MPSFSEPLSNDNKVIFCESLIANSTKFSSWMVEPLLSWSWNFDTLRILPIFHPLCLGMMSLQLGLNVLSQYLHSFLKANRRFCCSFDKNLVLFLDRNFVYTNAIDNWICVTCCFFLKVCNFSLENALTGFSNLSHGFRC